MTALALIEAGALLHPALEDCPGAVPLAAARWTDRQKMAALLQASALLAHLEHAGLHLAAGWSGARAGPAGQLLVAGVASGRSPRPAQELLRDLLGVLFGSAVAIPGRGEARRAARALLDAWRQPLALLSPDAAVGQVLAAAPFLWEPDFGAARSTLAASLAVSLAASLTGEPSRGSRAELWVAGPGPGRARLLARSRSFEELRSLLASPAARALWEDEGPAPSNPEERLAAAALLHARGRFARAKAALAGLRSPAAAVLRLRCLYQLGELGAVRTGLRRLAAAALSPAEVLETAEVAVRLFGNSRGPAGAERAGDWVERALAATGGVPEGPLHLRAHILAAGAAWDRQDAASLASLAAHLEAAGPARLDPALAWRWHQVRGLEALAAGDSDVVLASLGRALGGSRRHLSRHEAAGLWSDLGIGRSGVGDLRGAERAFRHAARLLGGCDGPRRTTLALFNLAEIRLRRGELSGVREILEQSTAENRLAGNLRGLTQDSELWVRLELVLGHPGAALTLCREALRQLDAAGSDWRRADSTPWPRAPWAGWGGARRPPWSWRRPPRPPAPSSNRRSAPPSGPMPATARRPSVRRPAPRSVPSGEPPSPASAWSRRPGRRWRGSTPTALPGSSSTSRASLRAPCPPNTGAPPSPPSAGPAPGSSPSAWRPGRRGPGGPSPPISTRLPTQKTRQLQAPRRPSPLSSGPPATPRPRSAWRPALGNGSSSPGAAGTRSSGRRWRTAGWSSGRRPSTPLSPLSSPSFAGSGASNRTSPPAGRRRRGGLPPAGRRPGRESPALKSALERLARLAPRDLTVLVLGETGTGKELAARLVHRTSPRAAGPFVAVNCAALGESLLLSDLFGHVRGAFTGADKDRAGVFETAQRGTVFLDELGDLPVAAQGMLLRVLQEREVRRVGESLPRRVDVRVVAATHRDLAAAVAAGTFREDLFYRLKVGSVELPPLRERGDDILLLAEHCLARQRGPGFVPTLSRRARELLLAHPFPGNVRGSRTSSPWRPPWPAAASSSPSTSACRSRRTAP